MKFVWDSDNRRFVTKTHCPWPECGAHVQPMHEDGLLGWCEACDRPYETILLAPDGGGAPVEWTLRPESAFNTYTGQPVLRYSPADWSECQGSPDRAGVGDDPRGKVFGRPQQDHTWKLKEGWQVESIAPEETNEVGDSIASLAVMRGNVLAISRRGRIGVLDPDSGHARTQRPIEWPGHPRPDARNPVDQPPAIRGTRMVLVSPRQALFRDLGPQLFRTQGGRARGAHRLIQPTDPSRRFVGPPMGIDRPDRPRFALLEARLNPTRSGLEKPVLRVFEVDGQEICQVAAQGLARGPVYARSLDLILWLDAAGFVHRLPGQALLEAQPEAQPVLISEQILDLRPSLYPTLAVAPNARGELELWVASGDTENPTLQLSRCNLEEALRRDEARWVRRSLGGRGAVNGLSVGRGPNHDANASGLLLSVSTDQAVYSYPKELVDSMEHATARGHDTAERRGSWDPPIITGAGVIARVSGSVQLMSNGMGWHAMRTERAAVHSRYNEAQGLALYGRRVFYGRGMGVGCFLLSKEKV